LGQGYYRFSAGPFPDVEKIMAGQFVHIRLPDTNIYFRRAFSVYEIDKSNQGLEIIFKIFGRGTGLLGRLHEGDKLDILGPLGNGFAMPENDEIIALVAGGIGMPPIYLLARQMVNRGYDPKKIYYFYGGNVKDDLVDLERIGQTGLNLITSTIDGSHGYRGMITEAMADTIDLSAGNIRMYACGPEGMLRAVDEIARTHGIPGQVSLEAPMPCGIGICLGCILPLRSGGYTRVCREGPVYDFGEVLI
jgi:dihydroorotate dehydrogenase electron transfer subunit